MWVEILISLTLEQTEQIGQFAVLLRKDFSNSPSPPILSCSLLQGCDNATIKKPPGKAAFLLPSEKHEHRIIKQKNRRKAVFCFIKKNSSEPRPDCIPAVNYGFWNRILGNVGQQRKAVCP